MDKSSIGLDSNVAGALAYGIGWVTGLAFLMVERDSRFVRFHALQSTIVFGTLCLAWVMSLSIPVFGGLLAFVIVLPFSLALWLFLMFKAYQGILYKLPIAGEMAEQRLNTRG
jgi:uncharacterized membrane protein